MFCFLWQFIKLESGAHRRSLDFSVSKSHKGKIYRKKKHIQWWRAIFGWSPKTSWTAHSPLLCLPVIGAHLAFAPSSPPKTPGYISYTYIERWEPQQHGNISSWISHFFHHSKPWCIQLLNAQWMSDSFQLNLYKWPSIFSLIHFYKRCVSLSGSSFEPHQCHCFRITSKKRSQGNSVSLC